MYPKRGGKSADRQATGEGEATIGRSIKTKLQSDSRHEAGAATGAAQDCPTSAAKHAAHQETYRESGYRHFKGAVRHGRRYLYRRADPCDNGPNDSHCIVRFVFDFLITALNMLKCLTR